MPLLCFDDLISFKYLMQSVQFIELNRKILFYWLHKKEKTVFVSFRSLKFHPSSILHSNVAVFLRASSLKFPLRKVFLNHDNRKQIHVR